MSYDLRKERLGTFAYFVKAGTVVDANTVDEGFFPDAATDPDAWSSLGCVIQASLEPETEESDPDYCPSPSGGYIKEVDTYTVRDVLTATLKCHCEIIWRLIWGVTGEMDNSTPYTPFTKSDRYVQGWINLQLRAEDGTDRARAVLWVKLRLAEPALWSKDPTKPVIRCEVVYSSIQSVEGFNIADIEE